MSAVIKCKKCNSKLATHTGAALTVHTQGKGLSITTKDPNSQFVTITCPHCGHEQLEAAKLFK